LQGGGAVKARTEEILGEAFRRATEKHGSCASPSDTLLEMVGMIVTEIDDLEARIGALEKRNAPPTSRIVRPGDDVRELNKARLRAGLGSFGCAACKGIAAARLAELREIDARSPAMRDYWAWVDKRSPGAGVMQPGQKWTGTR